MPALCRRATAIGLMGLYDTERALDVYQVPLDVRARLGTRRSISR